MNGKREIVNAEITGKFIDSILKNTYKENELFQIETSVFMGNIYIEINCIHGREVFEIYPQQTIVEILNKVDEIIDELYTIYYLGACFEC